MKIKDIKKLLNTKKSNIQTYYTGGGVWITDKHLLNGYYASINNDFINCLSIYKYINENETHTTKTLVYSKSIDKIKNKTLLELYKELKNHLLNNMW